DGFRRVRADAAVLGICSLHPDVGVTALDHDEALVKRAVVESAAEVLALATADKLRSAAPYVVASLADLDHVVSDAGAELTALYVPLLVLPLLAPSALALAALLAVFGAANGAMDVAMNGHGVAVERELGRPIMSSLHAGWSFGGFASAGLAALAGGAGVDPRV